MHQNKILLIEEMKIIDHLWLLLCAMGWLSIPTMNAFWQWPTISVQIIVIDFENIFDASIQSL